jgi:hypothetical protein
MGFPYEVVLGGYACRTSNVPPMVGQRKDFVPLLQHCKDAERAASRVQMPRVPDAVQRSSRCTAVPGPAD